MLWTCPLCRVNVYLWRTVCKRCGAVKLGGGRGSNEPSPPASTPSHAFMDCDGGTKLQGAGSTPEPMQEEAAEE